jgi:uncharacterized protein (TIGR03083 family)
MSIPGPIDLRHLFPVERASLLALLAELDETDWLLPTVCTGWTVHDLVIHLFGSDINLLAGMRDRFSGPPSIAPTSDLSDWDTLVAFIDGRNGVWVEALRRLSPRLLRDLLAMTGEQLTAFLPEIDMDRPGIPVSWAGSEPAPTWLHIAREYTERWVHHQQIRDAVNQHGFTEPEYFAPVLDTFIRALPYTLRDTSAPAGTTVRLVITGDAGGSWMVVRRDEDWQFVDDAGAATATVTIDQDFAWRLFTKGFENDDAGEISRRVLIEGDCGLAEPVTRMVTIIA